MAQNFRGTVEIADVPLRSAAPLSKLYWLPHGQSALERLGESLIRLFQLQSPFAPGLAFVGGEIDPARLNPAFAAEGPISIAGSGMTLPEALDACLGEAFEFLSQFEPPGEAPTALTLAEVGERTSEALRRLVGLHLPERIDASQTALDWIAATCLRDGRPVLVPADLSLRRAAQRRKLTSRSALSTGCAAGESFAAAVLRGSLELIERDAASLWWIGGRRGRPLGRESAAQHGATALLDALRQGRNGRHSWLLNITTDLAVPCIAALSVDPDGRALACGLAARKSQSEAARAAGLEMCQMEVDSAVHETKVPARGEAGLNAADRRHLARLRAIDANRCELLKAAGGPDERDAATAQEWSLGAIVERAAASGADLYVADLTRPMFGIAVARALAPDLQLMPSSLIGPVLRTAIARSGGGASHTCGLSLM